MKILLIAGHGDGDPGACGNGYREADLTREFVSLLVPELEGIADVDVFDMSKNCYKYLQKGGKVDFSHYDYVLEIHFDSNSNKDAKGCTMFVHNTERGTSVEQRILNAICLLGFKNRGVVKRGDLLVQNTCKKVYQVSHALLEVCFISNASDMDNYMDKKHSIVSAVVHGIKEGFGLSEPLLYTSAEDITDVLSRRYIHISDPEAFVMALQKAKDDNTSLYWGFYKLVNNIK